MCSLSLSLSLPSSLLVSDFSLQWNIKISDLFSYLYIQYVNPVEEQEQEEEQLEEKEEEEEEEGEEEEVERKKKKPH